MQGSGAPRGSNEPQGQSSRHRVQLPALHELESLPPPPDPSIPSSDPRIQAFYNPQDLGSISPGDPSAFGNDPYRSYFPGATFSPPGTFAPSFMHNPKRAYRQRRKDPSCDACRERKCDATETTSCTECSSRNVRCQFTKDTNRRMSSMKQVQDLERQLQEARQQLERVRSSEQKLESPETENPSPSHALAELPPLGKSPRRMLKARIPQDLGDARANVTDFGRGLFKPPLISANLGQRQSERFALPELPPHSAAEQLLRAYFEYFHRYFPVLYWPEFQQNFVQLYQEETSTDLPRETVALIFAVLACGAQRFRPPTHDQHGQKLLSMAISLIDMWEEDLSTTQILVVFLASVFLAEANRKSASWIWLGSAVRIAQDLGLHMQGAMWDRVEGEMRKRIWWSLYVWDRLLSTEMGKPMLINDEDCDIEYPDTFNDNTSTVPETLGSESLNDLLFIIPVSRLLSPISKLSRSLCIPNDTLTKFELHLGSCMYMFPSQLQLTSNSLLDPMNIAPLICFQNTRFMLHRHNLSPSCSTEQRSQAIDQCVAIACDTASVISRCVQPQSNDDDWQQKFVSSATTFLCTHLWRCMLFLLFSRRYDPFYTLLQISSLIGDTKLINISCGRNIGLFLRKMIDRQEKSVEVEGDQDEELIVYLSGDLQGCINSWVWGSGETNPLLRQRSKTGRPQDLMQEDEQGPLSDREMAWASSLSHDEQENWGGWALVERAAQYLQQVSDAGSGSAASQNPPQGSSRPQPPESRPSDDSGRSRMTIANII